MSYEIPEYDEGDGTLRNITSVDIEAGTLVGKTVNLLGTQLRLLSYLGVSYKRFFVVIVAESGRCMALRPRDTIDIIEAARRTK